MCTKTSRAACAVSLRSRCTTITRFPAQLYVRSHGPVQPGSMEGQLGALRRVCFGELGFVEQLDALDDDKKLL